MKRRQPVAIIETRPEREAEWLDLVRAVAPADVAVALATTRFMGFGPNGSPG